MGKKCLECGEVIVGRIDKKFCSDMCRNSFNNAANSIKSTYIRNVNNLLRKNRKIIEELLPLPKRKVTKEKLLEKGFNFYYFTNIYRMKNGKDCFFCYDYGYLPLENDYYMLLKKDEKE